MTVNPDEVRQLLNDHVLNKDCPEDTGPARAIKKAGQQ